MIAEKRSRRTNVAQINNFIIRNLLRELDNSQINFLLDGQAICY